MLASRVHVPKVAVIADFLEEGWPSMDLAAEELVAHLGRLPGVEAELVRPPLTTVRSGQPATALDRALGRFMQLPLELSLGRPSADYFHVADHSYAHLALLFPRDRVGVFCHDVDAFRALFPGSNASAVRIALSRLLLRGMRHARVVFHTTRVVREEILRFGLVPEQRLAQVPLGVAAEYLVEPALQPTRDRYLLHVGSCIPRKNVDFLLEVARRVLRYDGTLRLVQVGGRWTATQANLLEHSQLASRVDQLRGISRAQLASLYSGAVAVLVPSLSEGFGLPVIEALACQAPVVASDIPVLREVALDGAHFCSPTDVEQWVQTLLPILAGKLGVSPQTRDLIRARYSWGAHAESIFKHYTKPPFNRVTARRS